MYDVKKVAKRVFLIIMQDINILGEIINLPENIKLTNGSIIGICFKDNRHKERFISIFRGCDIKKLLKKLQGDGDHAKRSIDYIDQSIMESTLSVEEYLKFYGLIRNIYDVDFSQKMKKLLYLIDLSDKKDVPMKELKRSQQKSVRVLASCLNNLLLFVGNNLLDEMDRSERHRLYELLSLCLKEAAVCIVIEDTKDMLTGFADVIYEI